jgi:hypothetical protein
MAGDARGLARSGRPPQLADDVLDRGIQTALALLGDDLS